MGRSQHLCRHLLGPGGYYIFSNPLIRLTVPKLQQQESRSGAGISGCLDPLCSASRLAPSLYRDLLTGMKTEIVLQGSVSPRQGPSLLGWLKIEPGFLNLVILYARHMAAPSTEQIVDLFTQAVPNPKTWLPNVPEQESHGYRLSLLACFSIPLEGTIRFD